MATRERPKPWGDDECEKVKELIESGVTEPETIAAVMGCRVSDLGWLCNQAFHLTLKETLRKFSLMGVARVRQALFKAAIEDRNSKALDMFAREMLGLGAVETRRRKTAAAEAAEQEETDF
ncbi:MAG: hypothetical protein IKN60_04630 [Bacteroidales bacterium]|nr:hypothetical protein [Bacteroidales bacterium]